ncbi:hypothetical protein ACTA71_001105 [Dictyostelium dimigraforme]
MVFFHLYTIFGNTPIKERKKGCKKKATATIVSTIVSTGKATIVSTTETITIFNRNISNNFTIPAICYSGPLSMVVKDYITVFIINTQDQQNGIIPPEKWMEEIEILAFFKFNYNNNDLKNEINSDCGRALSEHQIKESNR